MSRIEIRCANGTESPPSPGRRFYSIQENDDGTLDVYLHPIVHPMTTPDGFTDYSITVLVVRGVAPSDGIEEDIRQRYDAWCASAETITI